MDWSDLLAKLAEPFPANLVQWRAGATSKDRKRAQALAYVDPREYERRLDALPIEWSVQFKPWGDSKLICSLTIELDGDRDKGIPHRSSTRESTGEYEEDSRAVAHGTAAEAQAFKRACSKFGLGRYLYDLPLTWVAFDDAKRRLAEEPTLPGWATPSEGGVMSDEEVREAKVQEHRQQKGGNADIDKMLSHARAAGYDADDAIMGMCHDVVTREWTQLAELTRAELLAIIEFTHSTLGPSATKRMLDWAEERDMDHAKLRALAEEAGYDGDELHYMPVKVASKLKQAAEGANA